MLVFVCSIGSSHSDKEVDPNTPEKVPRTTSERKRKRKVDDTGVVVAVQVGGKGARTASGDKKINDYFVKHTGNSPIRIGGAKSPSPQQGYPMVNNQIITLLLLLQGPQKIIIFIIILV